MFFIHPRSCKEVMPWSKCETYQEMLDEVARLDKEDHVVTIVVWNTVERQCYSGSMMIGDAQTSDKVKWMSPETFASVYGDR